MNAHLIGLAFVVALVFYLMGGPPGPQHPLETV